MVCIPRGDEEVMLCRSFLSAEEALFPSIVRPFSCLIPNATDRSPQSAITSLRENQPCNDRRHDVRYCKDGRRSRIRHRELPDPSLHLAGGMAPTGWFIMEIPSLEDL